MCVHLLYPCGTVNRCIEIDISTSYVDRLQSYSSPSSTPPRDPSLDGDEPDCSEDTAPKLANSVTAIASHDTDPELQPLLNTGNGHTLISEQYQTHTPLLYGTTHTHRTDVHDGARTCTTFEAISGDNDHHDHHRIHVHTSGDGNNLNFGGAVILEGHHRHEVRSAHSVHYDRGPRLPSIYAEEEDMRRMVLTVACAHGRNGDRHAHHDHDGHHGHGHVHGLGEFGHGDAEPEVKVGTKRQIIGILVCTDLFPVVILLTHAQVLQLGIMIHSLVIGLTLAIMSGSEFGGSLLPQYCRRDRLTSLQHPFL